MAKLAKALQAASLSTERHNPYVVTSFDYQTSYTGNTTITVYDYVTEVSQASKLPTSALHSTAGDGRGCAISPNGQYIAFTCANSPYAFLYDTFNLDGNGKFTEITLNPSKAFGDDSGNFCMFDLTGTKLLIRHDPPTALGPSVFVFDCATGQQTYIVENYQATAAENHPTNENLFFLFGTSSSHIVEMKWDQLDPRNVSLQSWGYTPVAGRFHSDGTKLAITPINHNFIALFDYDGTNLSNRQDMKPFDGSDNSEIYTIGGIVKDTYHYVNYLGGSQIGSRTTIYNTTFPTQVPIRGDWLNNVDGTYKNVPFQRKGNGFVQVPNNVNQDVVQPAAITAAGDVVSNQITVDSGTIPVSSVNYLQNSDFAALKPIENNNKTNAVPDLVTYTLSINGFIGKHAHRIQDVKGNINTNVKEYVSGLNFPNATTTMPTGFDWHITVHGHSYAGVGGLLSQTGKLIAGKLNAGQVTETGFYFYNTVTDTVTYFATTGGNYSIYLNASECATHGDYFYYSTNSATQTRIYDTTGSITYDLYNLYSLVGYNYSVPTKTGNNLVLKRSSQNYECIALSNGARSTANNTSAHNGQYAGTVVGEEYVVWGESAGGGLMIINAANGNNTSLPNRCIHAAAHSTKDHFATIFRDSADGSDQNVRIEILDWSDAKSGNVSVLYTLTTTVGISAGINPSNYKILGYNTAGTFLYIYNQNTTKLYKLETTNYTVSEEYDYPFTLIPHANNQVL
jgi:hypothetical protein